LELSPSNFISQKVVATAPHVTVSISAILHARKQQVMGSVSLAIEKLKARADNIKQLVLHTITNQRHTTTDSRAHTNS